MYFKQGVHSKIRNTGNEKFSSPKNNKLSNLKTFA